MHQAAGDIDAFLRLNWAATKLMYSQVPARYCCSRVLSGMLHWQNGRCKSWNLVFDALAFDSTLGFPGEGPAGRSIFDFFKRQHSCCDAASCAASDTACNTPSATHHAAEKLLPIDPEGLQEQDLLVAYCEEVLCNPNVWGKGIYPTTGNNDKHRR